MQNAKDFLQTKEGGKQFARFEFLQDKYSNGETTMQILEDNIEPDNLYLLDEPEVSLSPQNAKIYNLDTKEYKVQRWSKLENVRYFYEFFKSRKNEFEK